MEITEELLRKYYMQTFNTEAGRVVLQDLANRCFKNDTTFMPMVNMFREEIFIDEGKRQAFLHIESMMSEEGIAKAEGGE